MSGENMIPNNKVTIISNFSLVEKVMRLSPDERCPCNNMALDAWIVHRLTNAWTLFPRLKEFQKAVKLRFQDCFDIFVSTGLYGLLLEPWFEVFGSDLLVLSTDSLKGDNYNKTMNSVFNHIGLSPHEVPYVCTTIFQVFVFCNDLCIKSFFTWIRYRLMLGIM